MSELDDRLIASWHPDITEVGFRALTEAIYSAIAKDWQQAKGQFTDLVSAVFEPDAVVVDHRQLGMEGGAGETALRDAWAISALLPLFTFEIVEVSPPDLVLAVHTFRDESGNELVTPTVGWASSRGRIAGYVHFDTLEAARTEYERRRNSRT